MIQTRCVHPEEHDHDPGTEEHDHDPRDADSMCAPQRGMIMIQTQCVHPEEHDHDPDRGS